MIQNETDDHIVGKCPDCGRDVVESGNRYDCIGIRMPKGMSFEQYVKNSCYFGLYRDCLRPLGKGEISPDEMRTLLLGKAIPLTSLRRKDGGHFSCYGILDRNTGQWRIRFVDRPDQKSAIIRGILRGHRPPFRR